MDIILLLTRGPEVVAEVVAEVEVEMEVEVDALGVGASIAGGWLDDKMLAEYRAFISCTSCTPSSSLNTRHLLMLDLTFSWQSIFTAQSSV
jgi:hypothetical protein